MIKKFVPGIGTTLSITPSGGTITPLGQITKITPLDGDSEEIDVTDLDSTFIETLLSLPDGGSLKFTINYDSTNAGHQALWANFTETHPTKKSGATWTVTFNDKGTTSGTLVAFNGGVKSWPFGEMDPKSVATVEITVRVNGAVTITPAV